MKGKLFSTAKKESRNSSPASTPVASPHSSRLQQNTSQNDSNTTIVTPQAFLQRLTQHHLFEKEIASQSVEKQIKIEEEYEEDCKNLFALHKFEHLLFICDKNRTIRSINLKRLKRGDPSFISRYQTVVCSPPISFDVVKLILSYTCRYLCVVGINNCTIVELSSRANAELGKDQDTQCRTFSVGDFFHSTHPSITILQVSWHPFSDHHLAILTSDNTLRLYDLSRDTEDPEQTFRLNTLPRDNTDEPLQKAVSFSFGSTIRTWDRFTIYFMMLDGSMFAICPVIPYNCMIQASYITTPMSEIEHLIDGQTAANMFDEETITYYSEVQDFLNNIRGETVAKEREDEVSIQEDKNRTSGWIRTRSPYASSSRKGILPDIYLQGTSKYKTTF